MKTTKTILFSLLASIILILSVSSCAVKSHFLTSTVLPAAQGTVQVKIDNNNNYLIKIELSNLSSINPAYTSQRGLRSLDGN